MEKGLRGALLLLLTLPLARALLQYATTSYPTTSLAFVVQTFTVYRLGVQTVYLMVPSGFYTYVYNFTAIPMTFTYACRGNATIAFSSPTAVATANVIETVVTSATYVTTTVSTTYTLPSPFFYLLGNTTSTYTALYASTEARTLVLSSVLAGGEVVSLEGSAVILPASEAYCNVYPPLAVTIAFEGSGKATLYATQAVLAAPTLASAAAPLSVEVTTYFPVSAQVNETVAQTLFRVALCAPKPSSGEEVPALALASLALAGLLGRRRRS